jgi:RNA polymerase sigma factor (sigma-70 family)
MQDLDDLTLLREYAARNSEAAFAELVSRRVGFVYSAALRQVRDPHLAEEITQAVFIILAQKAGRISDKTILCGWLFKTTRYAAIAQTRDAAKRSLRTATIEKEFQMQSEIQATAPDALWEQMSPLLDEALATLGETDRQAVLLRFFENKSLAEVGSHLGTGEDTARKRVARALEKLHRYFNKRGVSSTTAILAGAISANSVQAAPVHLAKKIVTTVSSMTGTMAVSTFFGSVLGKVLAVCGSIAIVVVSAAIYFHAAGQSSSDKLPIISSQSILVGSNQNNLAPLQSSFNASNARSNFSEDSKLNDAAAHLRLVLHTRPITHQIYDYEQITNAIEDFGFYRRNAFNVLLDSSSDPEEFVREGAIAGMGYLGKYLPEVSPILWSMIYTSSSRDRWLILQTLQHIGFVPSDLPALTGLLTNGPISDGTYLTKIVPEAIAGVIETNPLAAQPYLASVENLLDDSNPDIRFRAALALIKFEGTNNPKIFISLHELFQRPNNHLSEYYKNYAAATLGNVGPAAQPLVPDLLDFAKSATEIGVQEAVYDSVARIEPDASSQNEDVAKALKEQEDAKMWAEKWKSGTYSIDDLRTALKDQYQAFTAANHLARMGTNAIEAVPDMIRALWGKDEDTRNKILEDIYKVDPRAVVTKISMTDINTGNLHEFLDKQPPTQQIKMLQQDVVTLELFSGWCLPEELADFTNKLAQQNQDAYKVFVKSQPHQP